MKPASACVLTLALLVTACGGGGDSPSPDASGPGPGRPDAPAIIPFSPEPPASPVTIPTKPGNYNYSPAIIDEGDVLKAWWCSATPSEATDQIWYQEYDKAAKTWSRLQSVLNSGTRDGDWDTFGVCHPSVIKGSWPGAPGGGKFTYAMYYTSTSEDFGGGSNNSTGVVFSTDGIKWSGQHAAHNPMIRQKVPNVRGTYGAGLPSVWSRGGSAVTMFWIDTTWVKSDDPASPDGYSSRALVATSDDGIAFSAPKLISREGAPAYWKNDFAFDDSVDPPVVYSAQALTFRSSQPPAKNETYNFGIYRIGMDDLLAGRGRWEELGVIDTNLTGMPLNFEPGIVRTPEGKVAGNVAQDGLQVWFGGGGQVPTTWGLRSTTVKIGGPGRLPLRRYSRTIRGAPSYMVTTGFVPPSFIGGGAGEPVELGRLDTVARPGQIGLYGCQRGALAVTASGELTDAGDRFISSDPFCEGAQVLGRNGFLFTEPPAGIETKPIYACRAPTGRFAWNDANCEGHPVEALFGHARAS